MLFIPKLKPWTSYFFKCRRMDWNLSAQSRGRSTLWLSMLVQCGSVKATAVTDVLVMMVQRELLLTIFFWINIILTFPFIAFMWTLHRSRSIVLHLWQSVTRHGASQWWWTCCSGTESQLGLCVIIAGAARSGILIVTRDCHKIWDVSKHGEASVSWVGLQHMLCHCV